MKQYREPGEFQKKQHKVQQSNLSTDTLEHLLQEAYFEETVPEDVNIRLKNQLTCHRVMGTNRISSWWLPATVSTVVSAAFAMILCLLYIIINIKGENFLMPNLLRLLSETWLKIHLAVIAFEIALSWIITIFCIWKGNLVRSAKILLK